MRKSIENKEKLRKVKCMNNYRSNTLNFLKIEKLRNNKK